MIGFSIHIITIYLYGMQRKDFKSRLFKKKLEADDLDYWFYLYADALYRLKLFPLSYYLCL